MRIRHKPHARAELEAWNRFCSQPRPGGWREHFASPTAPLRLEVGCGKGGFLARQALACPGANHIGIDIKNEMLLVAKRSTMQVFEEAGAKPENLLFCAYNIEKITEIFSDSENIERLYINFCNPWYKSGHAKHRLTHPRQLVQYRRFLAPGAALRFKTDDEPLFRDSLRYFAMCGFEIEWKTENLHAEEPADNIRTEHENMFAQRGLPIYACNARMVDADLDIPALSQLKDI